MASRRSFRDVTAHRGEMGHRDDVRVPMRINTASARVVERFSSNDGEKERREMERNIARRIAENLVVREEHNSHSTWEAELDVDPTTTDNTHDGMNGLSHGEAEHIRWEVTALRNEIASLRSVLTNEPHHADARAMPGTSGASSFNHSRSAAQPIMSRSLDPHSGAPRTRMHAASTSESRGPPDFKWVSDMSLVWQDRGSGGKMDVTIFKPQTGAGYARLGDHCWEGHLDHAHWACLVARRNAKTAEGAPMFLPPTGFNSAWDDSGSGAGRNVRIWTMIPPPGYVALGAIALPTHAPAKTRELQTQYVCVHQSLVIGVKTRKLLWWDKNTGTGRSKDISFLLLPDTGLFIARPGHVPSVDNTFSLKPRLYVPNISPEEKAAALEAHAPQIIFHPKESWWPSNVEYMRKNCKEISHGSGNEKKVWLTTKQHFSLDEMFQLIDDADNEKEKKALRTELQNKWLWIAGDEDIQNLRLENRPERAEIYSFWVQKISGVVDLVYFIFYPFNKGKREWGHHVGDWEHITVRCTTNSFPDGGERIKAFSCLYSYHSDEIIQPYSVVRKSGTHHKSPVAYVAEGSHGFWLTEGKHEYKQLLPDAIETVISVFGQSSSLYDITGNGKVWNTWEDKLGNDTLHKYEWTRFQENGGERRVLSKTAGQSGRSLPQWLSQHPGTGIYRWGNMEARTGGIVSDIVSLFGANSLEDGPTGPQFKKVLRDFSSYA